MSYHIRLKDYSCPSCNALYIPYKVDLPCPNCKKISNNITKEYFNFINELVISLRINKIKNGRYLPEAWHTGCFSEYVQNVIFHVFDALDKNKKDIVDNFVNTYLDSIDWDKDSIYRKDYIRSVFFEVYHRKNELSVGIWTKLLSKLLP